MPDHMKYLFLGMLLGVGIPFFIAGITLHITGFKIYKDQRLAHHDR